MMKTLLVAMMGVAVAGAILFGHEEELISEAREEIDPYCLQLADQNECDFYKCIGRRFPCTRRLLELGLHPTCTRMSRRRHDLTEQGQKWLQSSRHCFHTYLKKEYGKPQLPCDQFMDAAINAYMACADSVTPNMCQIFYENRRVITEVLHISLEQLIEEPRAGIKNVFGLLRMMSGCARAEVRSFLNDLKAELPSILRSKIRFPWESRK